MGSKKRSARQRQVAQFKEEMAGRDLGDAFERARRQEAERAERHDEALRNKACASKNRYATRDDALEAIARCEEHGQRGLSCYRCSYCHGWHLTSHPRK